MSGDTQEDYLILDWACTGEVTSISDETYPVSTTSVAVGTPKIQYHKIRPTLIF